MSKCWTCGAATAESQFECSQCKSNAEVKKLRDELSKNAAAITTRLDSIADVGAEGFREIASVLDEGLAGISTKIEWGFTELQWQLGQQHSILKDIDHTLKTPSETQANEWRLMAEELRARKVLDESEEFFVKALDLNRLDYRIYVGLAQTLLQQNNFRDAQGYLERSLPHAPTKEIDYRSYSLRLIGHIHECSEDYVSAATNLRKATELSPQYAVAHYDFAQYSARLGDSNATEASLRKAIAEDPIYWYLSTKEPNFNPVQAEVRGLLELMQGEARQKASRELTTLVTGIEKVRAEHGRAQKFIDFLGKAELETAKVKLPLRSSLNLSTAEELEEEAKASLSVGDYRSILEAANLARKAQAISAAALEEAKKENEDLARAQKAKKEKLAEAAAEAKNRKQLRFLFLTLFILYMIFWGALGVTRMADGYHPELQWLTGLQPDLPEGRFFGALRGVVMGFLLPLEVVGRIVCCLLLIGLAGAALLNS